MNKLQEFLIEGRENCYKLTRENNNFKVYIKYDNRKEWSIDDKFESFNEAVHYINSCLAHESYGLAWKFRCKEYCEHGSTPQI